VEPPVVHETHEGCHCDCSEPHVEEPPVVPKKKCTCCQPKVVVMSLEMPLTCETFTPEKRDAFQCAIGRVTLSRSLRMFACLCLCRVPVSGCKRQTRS
jgi:hypothetical protein